MLVFFKINFDKVKSFLSTFTISITSNFNLLISFILRIVPDQMELEIAKVYIRFQHSRVRTIVIVIVILQSS